MLRILCIVFLGLATPSSASAGSKDLRLSLTLSPSTVSSSGPMLVQLEIENLSKRTLKLRSHVQTHERHYDEFALTMTRVNPSAPKKAASTNPKKIRVVFVDARDKSYPVTKTLKPGQSIRHTIDLQKWLSRAVNKRIRLQPGSYLVRASYVATAKDSWRGTLRSRPRTLRVTGPKNRGAEKNRN